MQAPASIPPLLLVVTSAGVAAVVSSLVTLVGQYLERRARRNELILRTALDMATAKAEFVFKAATATGIPAESGLPGPAAARARISSRWSTRTARVRVPPQSSPTK